MSMSCLVKIGTKSMRTYNAVLVVQHLCSALFYFVDIKTEIEDNSREYIAHVTSLNKEEKAKSLNRIQEMFKKATENSDNKVQIAMQMYEMVSPLSLYCSPPIHNAQVLVLIIRDM